LRSFFPARQPTGNASIPYWTLEVDLGGAAHAFVDDKLNGFGLTGVWGAGNVPESKGDSGREQAEVWFDKV